MSRVRYRVSRGLTKDVADAFVAGLEEDEEVLDEHPERQDRVLVLQVVVVELSASLTERNMQTPTPTLHCTKASNTF